MIWKFWKDKKYTYKMDRYVVDHGQYHNVKNSVTKLASVVVIVTHFFAGYDKHASLLCYVINYGRN